MPTIDQLPAAATVFADDELPVSQDGVTRNVAIGMLLAGTQRTLMVNTGALLGRVSLGAGPAESIALGTGLALQSGILGSTGLDHAAFPMQPVLTLTDTVVLSSAGQPHQMPVGALRGLYTAGANVTINAAGVVAASAVAGPAGPAGVAGPPGPTGAAGAMTNIVTAPATAVIAPSDLLAISQAGANRTITLANLLAGTDVSATRAAANTGRTAYAVADRFARVLDPRDFSSNMFSGATSQDDGIGIQAAINFAQAEGGGTIRLPKHGAVNGQLATSLVISQSGICLVGQSRSMLSHDNTGPYPECAVKLRWTGAVGGTMLRVAPPVNLLGGTPVSGCDIGGFLLDCNGIAGIGALFASMRHSRIDLMVAEATADGVLLDTIDIGEANDCQSNEFRLLIRILTTRGNAFRLAGTARAMSLGNSSYNQIRSLGIIHNSGDALVLDYADSNAFDKVLIQNRPSFTTTTGTAGAGRSIVFKGSSEVVTRASGPVSLFGANNNVFNQLSCAGPIASLGHQSGYTAPAVENRILRFDAGNNPLNLVTETGASIQVSTTENVDLALAAALPSFGNAADQVRLLRDARGGEAVAITSTTGDHVQLYQFGMRMWGYGIDGANNDLRFAASNAAAGQLNLGNGQGAYSLNGLGVGARLPPNTPPGVVYLADIGSNAVPNPPTGAALYVSGGALLLQTTAGVKSTIAPMTAATTSRMGGVVIGANLTVNAAGVVSAAAPGTGPTGPVGPAYTPPSRTVTGTTDTPGSADDTGTIAYGSSLATTVTVADLGPLRRYAALQIGTGKLTFVPAAGVTLSSQGQVVASASTAYQGAALTVIGTGTGKVYLIGNLL